jgi:G3E family GTPase
MNAPTKRPITIVTGFLGSGKTTLLRRLLAGPEARDTAVLVNEFGEVGLDHHLVQRLDEQTILLGGVCGTVRDDLVRALADLLDRDQRGAIPRLKRVVIETTGLADPAPILFTVVTDPMLQHHFRVESVVTTVDAVNGPLHLDRHPESEKQVVIADEIIVTKTDLVSPDTVVPLLARLQAINPTAPITTAVFGNIDPRRRLWPGDGSPPETRLASASQLTTLSPALDTAGARRHHAGEIRSLALSFAQPLDWIAFSVWLSMLLHARGEDVLRVKGFLNVGASGPVVLNGVQHIIHAPEHLERWPGTDQRSHLVFMLRAIEPQSLVRSLQAFQHLLGAQPQVDDTDLHLSRDHG